jgi:F-type H+-transporting ATPase subunit b
MEPIINAFHIDYKIMISQVINFGIVFGVLYFYALKPLVKIMRERTEKIEKGIDDAKKNAEILGNTKNEYEKALTQAKNEAHEILQEGKKDAEKRKNEMLEEAKKEVATMIENGKKSIEAEKVKIMSETKGEIASLAIKMTEKIIGERLNGNYDEKIVKEINNL